LGFYKIAVPADGKSNSIFIWSSKKEPFLIKHDNYSSLNLFIKNPKTNSAELFLTLQDKKRNGFYNNLGYLIQKGNDTSYAVDMDMDGQIDLRLPLDLEKEKAQIWLNNEWTYLHTTTDQKQGIIRDGKFIRVKFTDSKWQLTE
jgi:hypothetical protein